MTASFSSGSATSISSQISIRNRSVGISERPATRWATRLRSAVEASRSTSTRRSDVMARSKAFTRLEGRLTTSASRLISATRARRGGACTAKSSGGATSSNGSVKPAVMAVLALNRHSLVADR